MARASTQDGWVGSPRFDARLRRVSARATKSIADRYGMRLGMWFGAGYPKSGTTFLCNLMSSYLDVPLVRKYRLPVLMPCVIHSHWQPSARTPRTVYIVRDGRDVVVSRYFFETKAVASPRNPRAWQLRQERLYRLYGRNADLADVAANLPKFIEAEMTVPQLTGVNWAQHIEMWLDMPRDRVAVVHYERLLTDVSDALAPVFEQLTGHPADRDYLSLAGERFEFTRQARRNALGDRDGAFMRKGVAGDWRIHFNAEARQVFDHFAGAMSDRLGYPKE